MVERDQLGRDSRPFSENGKSSSSLKTKAAPARRFPRTKGFGQDHCRGRSPAQFRRLGWSRGRRGVAIRSIGTLESYLYQFYRVCHLDRRAVDRLDRPGKGALTLPAFANSVPATQHRKSKSGLVAKQEGTARMGLLRPQVRGGATVMDHGHLAYMLAHARSLGAVPLTAIYDCKILFTARVSRSISSLVL
jgi:hypothetical protein